MFVVLGDSPGVMNDLLKVFVMLFLCEYWVLLGTVMLVMMCCTCTVITEQKYIYIHMSVINRNNNMGVSEGSPQSSSTPLWRQKRH